MQFGQIGWNGTPYGVTAQAKNKSASYLGLHSHPHNLFGTAVEPEQLMELAIVLQAIAEQDSRFVVVEQSGKRGERERQKAVAEATAWVADGKQMREICDNANLPYEFLRSRTPEQANDALSRLLSGVTAQESEPDAEDDLRLWETD